METFNPGFCTVEKADVTSHDGRVKSIQALIHSIVMSQSITSTGLAGNIKVYDSVGFLHNFPLRAEEKLDLKLKGHDLQTEINIKGQITKIDDVSKNTQGDGYFYTLHFSTRTSYNAGLGNVITAFRDKTGSYAAKNLFKKHFNSNKDLTASTKVEEMPPGSNAYAMAADKGRRFYIEDSKGQLRVLVPDYNPHDAMVFLASKSMANSDSPSNNFRFFETFEGYYWVTDEWLLKRAKFNKDRVKDFYYLSFTEKNPLYAEIITKTITSFNNSDHVDTGADLQSGAYTNTVLEIDLTSHDVNYYNYDYETQKKRYAGMSGAPKTSNVGATHSSDFIKDTFTTENAKQYVVYRDWQDDGMQQKPEQQPRPPQKMVEIIQNRIAYRHHLNNSKVQMTATGRLDLMPGDVINLITQDPTIELSNEMNERLSGKYLISNIRHNISENQLETHIDAIKYGWEKGIS